MIRTGIAGMVFISLVWFPWPLALAAAVLGAFASPVFPLMAGVCADLLYYAPGAAPFPLYTLCGALVSLVSFFVHRFVETSIIR